MKDLNGLVLRAGALFAGNILGLTHLRYNRSNQAAPFWNRNRRFFLYPKTNFTGSCKYKVLSFGNESSRRTQYPAWVVKVNVAKQKRFNLAG